MIQIGRIYMQHTDGQARLCADIASNQRGTTLWFAVSEEKEAYLCPERSDAFVMALLPMAMRGGHEIVCETPMSERLHYQLEQYLIPSLAAAGTLYHLISIKAPLEREGVKNRNGVGTGFSGGVDSMYTIMTHGRDSIYPVTHLAIFNVGVFEGENYHNAFRRNCQNAERFAKQQDLELVPLDSNISEVLPERFLDVYSFRNLAGALALQGLFSVYLLSSGHDIASFSFDLHDSGTYDLLTINCAQTESLAIYSSGSSVMRREKLEALIDWEPAYEWLHPCPYGLIGTKNCGHCKKCTRDMTTLYALGVLERFEKIFDVPSYYKALPQRLGFLLANRESHLYQEPLDLIEKKGIEIPQMAYTCEQQFRRALKNLEETQK